MQLVIKGIITNYENLGAGSDVVVILPGWKRSLDEWLPLAKGLSERFRVVLIDFPGFGLTPAPNKSYDIFDYADFVKEFLTKLDINNPILVGHSFGGRVAVVLSSRDKLSSRLVLIDSAGLMDRSVTTKIKQVLLRGPLHWLVSRLPFLEILREGLRSEDYRQAGDLRETFIKVVNQDLGPLLHKIKVPTLIVWGEKDTVLEIAQAKTFHQLVHGSALRIAWGAGHDPHLQKPEQLLEILEDYL